MYTLALVARMKPSSLSYHTQCLKFMTLKLHNFYMPYSIFFVKSGVILSYLRDFGTSCNPAQKLRLVGGRRTRAHKQAQRNRHTRKRHVNRMGARHHPKIRWLRTTKMYTHAKNTEGNADDATNADVCNDASDALFSFTCKASEGVLAHLSVSRFILHTPRRFLRLAEQWRYAKNGYPQIHACKNNFGCDLPNVHPPQINWQPQVLTISFML